MDAKNVIQRLCELQALVYTKLGESEPADCFCGHGGFWGAKDYDGTYENGYRNSGRCLEFIEKAVREKLATEDKKAPVDAETFLQSKDIWHHPMVMDRSHKTGYEIADLLTEHASNERTKAIQQCEDFIKDWYENERALEGKDFYTELSKLKK